ncbi:AQUAPORIN SIP1-1 [Salix koriyanagi]|uniref:AQUAPORIN SIP1-1 n=1 Tax=Salix koriyanagi TaxID=2511006 RepID=A0A9Q0W6M2_9ROSI|nr:AQUAPORIN SIP1-1 [Salix koriyanagi]
MAAIQAAFGDAVLTFMWVFVSSMFGLFTNLVVTALGLQTLGGASFNPTGTASFYAAGVGGDTLFSMALKFPAQAAGAVGGALAIMEVMPVQYKHMLGGPYFAGGLAYWRPC